MPAAARLLRGLPSHAQKAWWLLAVWVIVFWRLGEPSLMDPDEAHYAQLTREMLRAGQWLVPTLDGQPYIDKPVFFHWLQGASMTLLGETEVAVRLPSALAAVALIWITYRLGRARFGCDTAHWAAAMFATIPLTFALASIGLFDMVFAACLFGAIACLIGGGSASRMGSQITGFGLLALAIMTKGPVAVLLGAVFFVGAWIGGGETRAWARGIYWKTGLAAAALAASPWFVWMYHQFGDVFVRGYLLDGNLHYVTQPASFSGRSVSYTYYVRVFAGGFFPWSLVLIGRIADWLSGRRSRIDVAEKLLWLWAAVVVAFFSVARFKLDHYIFPAAPAVALLAAKAWQDAVADEGGRAFGVRAVVLGLGGLLVAGGTFLSFSMFDLDLRLPATAVALPVLLAVGGAATLTAAARRDWRVPSTPAVVLVTLVGVYALAVAIGFPTLERVRPTAAVARTLKLRTPRDAPSAIYGLEPWHASLRFYADRPLVRLSNPGDVARFLAQDKPVFMLMRRRDYRALRLQFPALREVFSRPLVVGTIRSGTGLRKQQWGDIEIITNAVRPVYLLP